MDEKVYQCPRCRSGPRPRGQWATRYGIMTCGVCLNLGYVIIPEEVDGVADLTRCEKCGGQRMHTRLAGYKCTNPRCC